MHDREAVKCAAAATVARDRGHSGEAECNTLTAVCDVCAMSLYVSDSIQCVIYRSGVE